MHIFLNVGIDFSTDSARRCLERLSIVNVIKKVL